MSWDSFKHIISSYPDIKTKFNNYLNKHQSGAVWRAKSQSEQVREFITGFLDGFDGPGVRAKDAVEKALRFRQKPNMTTSTYLELKELRFDEALREGNAAGHVDTRIREEPERCRNAVEHLLTSIETAVLDHLTDASLAGHLIAGYQMDHFTEWTVMAKRQASAAPCYPQAARPEVQIIIGGSIWEEHDEGAGFGERGRAGGLKEWLRQEEPLEEP